MAKTLAMIEGSSVVHQMINARLARCGRWNANLRAVPSVPAGCRMCKRCTRLDGIELGCGHDVSDGALHRDGVTAWCYRCAQHVNIIREAV